jgi:hypothetical protein
METKINISIQKKNDHRILPDSRKMFQRQRLFVTGAILFLIWFIFSPPTHGMRLHHPFKQVANEADLVFVGTVVHQEARWDDGGKMIFTHVHFAVNEIISDQTGDLISGGQELILPFAGGQIDDQAMSVSDVPVFRDNDTYVIFARLDGKRYASPTIGGFQGVFRVIDDEVTDQRYPLTAGGQAISSVLRGELIKKSAVSRIRNGVMELREDRWRQRRRGTLPQPAMDMGPARAEVAPFTAGTPTGVMTLAEFIDEIRRQIGDPGKEAAP